MASKQKVKGYRFEHFLEQYLNQAGIKVRRRGQANQEDLYFDDLQMTGEAKSWAKGISTVFKLKGDRDILFLKWSSKQVKNKPILIVMQLETFIKLIKKL